MKTLKFKIEGVCPLLQHDDKTANPFNEYAKQLKAISSKRKKTEDDLLEMARIEWLAGLYHTPQSGYFMKAECFEGSFYEAAKAKKLGKTFKEAVRIPDDPAFHFEHEALSPDQLFSWTNTKISGPSKSSAPRFCAAARYSTGGTAKSRYGMRRPG